MANLEAATGVSFPDLYRAWSVALFTSGLDPARPDRDAFRSVDVRGSFDAWALAGPRTVPLAPGDSDACTLTATASRFLVVGASGKGPLRSRSTRADRRRITSHRVPLPEDLADLTLSAHVTTSPDGAPSFDVTIREHNGTSVRLSALAWEPLIPGPDPHASTFRRGGLNASDLGARFGTLRLAPFGRLSAHGIPARDALDPHNGPVVVKVVGTDSRGRRVSAWAEVEVR